MLNNSVVMGVKILVIIINVCILYYVVDMEKKNCKCSDSWLRDYIKIVSSILITFSIISLVIPSFQSMIANAIKKNKLAIIPVLAWNIVAIGYIGVLLTYYYRLDKDPNCKCSENWKRFMLLYPIVFLIPIILAVLVLLGKKVLRK